MLPHYDFDVIESVTKSSSVQVIFAALDCHGDPHLPSTEAFCLNIGGETVPALCQLAGVAAGICRRIGRRLPSPMKHKKSKSDVEKSRILSGWLAGALIFCNPFWLRRTVSGKMGASSTKLNEAECFVHL